MLLGLLAAACTFPTPSQDYACETDGDCGPGRACRPAGEGRFCVLSTVVDAATADADAPDADTFAVIKTACLLAGYVEEPTAGNGLYRAIATEAMWTASERACEQDVVGATHLIVISDATELAFAKTRLGWVGYTDVAVEGTFASVTAEPFVAAPWAGGQPDNGDGDENCAHMKTPSGLDDDQCDSAHRAICECDGRPPLVPIP